ncbi:UNVERIFIED_CONTAM: hypothetical protein Scaly_1100700 [Sesamum calycinum]|uniref:Uncharacterized protein n=1 Tax=Sesamum calycinum TaxID=2727403 RepID=A0AAW2QLW4_9LAMI
MKGREGKGPPSADLLVCFPSRAHLSLMPKPICSPARPSEPSTRHHQHRHRQRHHMRKSSINRGGGGVGGGGGGGHASPLLWAKSKNHNSDISEPTSPKVTCAGQIKVRPKPSSCKNWQSVMEEIERLHNNRKQKKRSAWIEALGFKKEVMQFLTCLRNIRFDFRCFGAFPAAEITSDDDDDEDDDEDEEEEESYHRKSGSKEENDHDSRAVFSKWFMILQENQGKEFITREEREGKMIRPCSVDHQDDEAPSAPPPNALLLMRCRSAPAKSWLEEKAELEEKDDGKEQEKQNLVVMRCGADFSKFSSDIAKETWVVGGIKDMLSRSRSSKR